MMYRALAAGLLASLASAEVNYRKLGWKQVARAPKDTVKTFSVAMPMGDFDGLDKTLSEISDPYNARYGQWLTKEQADAFTRTPAEIVDEVYGWATSTGAACEILVESLKCAGTVAQIEELLSTELSTFAHTKTGKNIIRVSADATVPIELTGKVVMVTGLVQFPVPRLGSRRPIEVIEAINGPMALDPVVVPQVLKMFYNITTDDGSSASSQGPIEFQGYPAYTQSDSDAFATNVGMAKWTVPTSQIIGPFAPGAGADESELDEQYVAAIGLNNNNWYWTEADWLYEFGQHISTLPDAGMPKVFSISYAWSEHDQCDISPGVGPCNGAPVPSGSYLFVAAVNQLFAKATARGITMSSAAGDSGAHGRTDPGCTDPVVRPAFPASSPYITAVGATEIANGQTGPVAGAPICSGTYQCATGGYEVVASNAFMAFYSSGGGFSNVAARPTWQDAAVSAYLKNTTAQPPAGDFNATGRGFPDVAALGHNFYVEIDGSPALVDGTSASTPTWSGIVANLNAVRLAAGKPVLGFINPLLYSLYAKDPTIFNDVVQGDNTCTEDACPCPAGDGFYAAPGWDATTGLGTPNYGKLKAAILAMSN